MDACPKCTKLSIFSGATDCPRCGYVLVPEPPEEPKTFGNPLYPQYRKPSKAAPLLLMVMGIGMVGVGIAIAATPGEGSCGGYGGTLCLLAARLLQVISGSLNLRIAEGSMWVSFGLGSLAAAWHLHAMWFRKTGKEV